MAGQWIPPSDGPIPPIARWSLRLAIAAVAAPIVLYGLMFVTAVGAIEGALTDDDGNRLLSVGRILMALWALLGIVALVLALVARRRIKASAGALGGLGKTTAAGIIAAASLTPLVLNGLAGLLILVLGASPG